ncbi:MAG TPA: hypothetical protein VK921_01355 [Anditalea sp.]|nr:hypothetical protein [Anditalea sp.]
MAKERFIANPNKRKGRSKSHRMGYNNTYIMAKGQHKTNKINQSKKEDIIF